MVGAVWLGEGRVKITRPFLVELASPVQTPRVRIIAAMLTE